MGEANRKAHGGGRGLFLGLGFTTLKLLDEEHFAIGRQGPEVVADDGFKVVGGFADFQHGWDHLVLDVLGVGVGVAVAVVGFGFFQGGDGADQIVDRADHRREYFNTGGCCCAGGLGGGDAFANFLLILQCCGQDDCLGHQQQLSWLRSSPASRSFR